MTGLVAACWAAATGNPLLFRVKHSQPTLHAALAGLCTTGCLFDSHETVDATAVEARSMDGGDDRPGVGHLAFSALQLTTAVWPELAEERTRYRGSGACGDDAALRRVTRMD